MQEITVSEKTYFFIRKRSDTVLQEIVAYPGQTLATKDGNTVFYDTDRRAVIAQIESVLGPQVAFNDCITKKPDGVYNWGEGYGSTFFIFAMPSVAEPLSRALYGVVNPGQDGLYARVYPHPDPNQYSLMEFRHDDIVPIALGADPTPLADALAITVTDGALTQEEVDNIVGAISAYAGQEINLVDFIPPSWAGQQVDKQTAITLGYNLE